MSNGGFWLAELSRPASSASNSRPDLSRRAARYAPASTEEVVAAVRAWPGKIAVGGGRYSMGGQVAITGGLHLDMRGMNRLLRLDADARVARV